MVNTADVTVRVTTSSTLEESINDTLLNAKELASYMGSRELSLVITKLEEAQMWLDRIVKE